MLIDKVLQMFQIRLREAKTPYEKAMESFFRASDKMVATTGKEFRTLFKRLANSLKQELLEVDTPQWRIERINALSDGFARYFARFDSEAESVISVAQRNILRMTDEQLPLPPSVVALSVATPIVDDAFIQGIASLTFDLVQGVSDDMRAAIKRDVGLSLLQGQSPQQAAKQITKYVNNQFYKAERITRTEMLRAQSIAQDKRYEQANQALQNAGMPLLKKTWIWSHKPDGRNGHKEAEQRYREGIPMNAFFEVRPTQTSTYEKMQYPRDPRASAKNTVNCGCRMVAVQQEPPT